MSNALVLQQNAVLAGPINAGSLEQYMHTVSSIPVLEAEEERTLAERFQQQQDLMAAQQLVLSHLRFVVHVARSYNGYGLQLADLIQEGNVGLMKAVKRFDPERGVRLVAFAAHWIRAEIHDYVIRNWRIVKVATTKAQRKLFFNLRKSKKRLAWFTAAEVDAVANDLGVAPKDVLEMESRLSGRDISLLGESDDDDESYRAPIAQLAAPLNADPARVVEAEQIENRNHERLKNAIAALDARSREIVESRWVSEPKATLHDLAARFEVSAERIRQIEANAMRKLRDAVGTDWVAA